MCSPKPPPIRVFHDGRAGSQNVDGGTPDAGKKWGYWHPYLPFLGDEVTGKTVAIIGTGRIGLAMIKKCAGFDMNILCYDPAYQNHEYVKAIQETMDLRHARGICKEKNWIKYVPLNDALRQADFVSVHVPLLREGEVPHRPTIFSTKPCGR